MKTVKRTYFSKKLNRNVTKVYTYSDTRYKYKHKSTRGKILVNDKGKINKKNLENFMNEIDNSDADSREKIALKDYLLDVVHGRSNTKKKLTTAGFQGIISEDDITRMFANAGYDIYDVADEYDLMIDDLLDQANWKNDIFTNPANGLMFQMVFNYTQGGFLPYARK